jgi:NAD(P)-dependent dehydrogenase (short-subunit alcohol dehydrogenase family)
VKAAMDKTIGTFGRLDLAFNNAGVEQPVKALADVKSRNGAASSTSACAACSCA